MVEELGGRRACSGLRLGCDTALVTMTQESAACVDLFSHEVVYGVVGVGSVLGFVVWWCCFDLLYHCFSSYIAFLLI
jgi:hypothetical protein